MDAVAAFMEKRGIEPEDSRRLVMSSKPVYENLLAECQSNKLLKRSDSVL
jgi:hypothetical protein